MALSDLSDYLMSCPPVVQKRLYNLVIVYLKMCRRGTSDEAKITSYPSQEVPTTTAATTTVTTTTAAIVTTTVTSSPAKTTATSPTATSPVPTSQIRR